VRRSIPTKERGAGKRKKKGFLPRRGKRLRQVRKLWGEKSETSLGRGGHEKASSRKEETYILIMEASLIKRGVILICQRAH